MRTNKQSETMDIYREHEQEVLDFLEREYKHLEVQYSFENSEDNNIEICSNGDVHIVGSSMIIHTEIRLTI